MKISLKEMAALGNRFAIIRIDETEFWSKSIVKKAKKIEGIYLVNLTEPTNLCSFEINYPSKCLRNFLHKVDKFSEDELYELEYVEGVYDCYPYFLESDKFELVRYYNDEEETEEDIIEYESANPSYC